jgi:hypothetical protein
MSVNRFQLTKFSKKTLEECQKCRDENYERNTNKVKSPS